MIIRIPFLGFRIPKCSTQSHYPSCAVIFVKELSTFLEYLSAIIVNRLDLANHASPERSLSVLVTKAIKCEIFSFFCFGKESCFLSGGQIFLSAPVKQVTASVSP